MYGEDILGLPSLRHLVGTLIKRPRSNCPVITHCTVNNHYCTLIMFVTFFFSENLLEVYALNKNPLQMYKELGVFFNVHR